MEYLKVRVEIIDQCLLSLYEKPLFFLTPRLLWLCRGWGVEAGIVRDASIEYKSMILVLHRVFVTKFHYF